MNIDKRFLFSILVLLILIIITFIILEVDPQPTEAHLQFSGDDLKSTVIN